MLRVDEEFLRRIEERYPGIRDQVFQFENQVLPKCSRCGSMDTADVQIGIIGRTIHIAAATTKIALILNPPRPGRYFCNSCRRYFDPQGAFRKPRKG